MAMIQKMGDINGRKSRMKDVMSPKHVKTLLNHKFNTFGK